MIVDFKCAETARIARGEASPRFPQEIQDTARRKLRMLDQATDLRDLRALPGNRLEALKGNRKGQHSIRVNNQFRICFVWREGNAYQVEMVDYH